MKTEARRYMLLDAMRGVAALAVVWGHITDTWERPELTGNQFILAVDFFFILSGFVIGHAYGDRMRQGMSSLRFCLIRSIRLHPMLIISAIFGTIVLLVGHAGEPGYGAGPVVGAGVFAMLGLPGFFFLPSWQQHAFPINGPAWSLFFELCASFIYAFIARYLTRSRLIAITVLTTAIFIAIAFRTGTIEWGWQKAGLTEGFARVLFGFFAGLLLYELRPHHESASWIGYPLLIVLAICLLEPIRMNASMQLFVAVIVFPALIWQGSTVREDSFIARAGSVLGALSYPLYILHRPFVEATREGLRTIDPQGEWLPLWIVLQFALVITVAWVAMKAIDEPVRAWLMRKLRRQPPSPPAATPVQAAAP